MLSDYNDYNSHMSKLPPPLCHQIEAPLLGSGSLSGLHLFMNKKRYLSSPEAVHKRACEFGVIYYEMHEETKTN